MGKLAIVFFIAARLALAGATGEPGALALRAFPRPTLRSGLLQARRANGVRLCSHTCPGLNAHCSPLFATRQMSATESLTQICKTLRRQMPLDVHGTMQDSGNYDSAFNNAVQYEVPLAKTYPTTWTHVITHPPSFWVCSDPFKTLPETILITVRLTFTPSFKRGRIDPLQVRQRKF